MDKRRVVITGIGAITPIGHSAAESWRAVRDGVCGVASITAFDVTDQKVTLAAEVKDYQPEDFLDKKEAKHMDLVSFVDYESDFYQLYASQIDSIVQPVNELGVAAGEEILKRVENPDAPIFEKVLTSSYRPYDLPKSWNHSDR